jgi:uncharacterized membrane protein YtjA (UPF0391 family)
MLRSLHNSPIEQVPVSGNSAPAPSFPQLCTVSTSHLQRVELRSTARKGFARSFPPAKVVVHVISFEGGIMLYWTLVFLVFALIAGVLGFTGVAIAAAGIAKLLFVIFLVFFVISLFAHVSRRGSGV